MKRDFGMASRVVVLVLVLSVNCHLAIYLASMLTLITLLLLRWSDDFFMVSVKNRIGLKI